MKLRLPDRSNAGKSSAINTLTRTKGLARTSKTPGRTQLINFFELSNGKRLVDLPGYGYAKVPIAMKREWDKHLAEYLQMRQSLAGLVLLMDIRHPLQEFDLQMLNWAAQAGLPVHILLTKSDKLKRGPAQSALLWRRAPSPRYGSGLHAVERAGFFFAEKTGATRTRVGTWALDERRLCRNCRRLTKD